MVVRVERTPGILPIWVRSRTEMLRAAGADLDQVTVIARHVMDLEDLGQLAKLARDAVVRRTFGAAHGNESEHALAQRGRIQLRGYLGSRGAIRVCGCVRAPPRRQSDGPRDLNLRFARILLQLIEYSEVDFVDCSVKWRHDRILYDYGGVAHDRSSVMDSVEEASDGRVSVPRCGGCVRSRTRRCRRRVLARN